jgi:cysteine desulfurase/selenocysteine lyase
MAFDVEAARAEFPILQRRVNGRPLVYLDSAASAQKPRAVIEAMSRAMETSYANVHRGLHTLANETTEAYEKARENVRQLINVASASEIVFTKGTTEAINLVASSFGQSLVAGDEIVLSVMEHHANIVPWHFLRERKGVVLRFIPITDAGELDLAAYRNLLGPRTRMVAVSHMSNVLGTINPVREIVAEAHAAGALTLIDGAQAVVHGKVDVQALDADFYAFSGHKLYGPTGVGALYGKAERLAALPPYQGGGEMIGRVTLDEITYADPPHRFEAGTPPIIEAIGLSAAIEWLGTLDRDAVAEHEHALYDRLKTRLNGANWIREIGQSPDKGAIFAFTMEGAHAHDVAQILDRYGVAVRAGTHCAEPLLARYGLTSSARASFALYNTLEEADSFVEALEKTRTFFS